MPKDNFGLVSGAWGEQLDSTQPDYVDAHRLATEDAIEWARMYWPQVPSESFAMYGTTGRRVTEVATGIVYTTVESDPHQLERPEDSPIEYFTVNSGWIFYLRRVGTVEAETAGVVGLHAATVAGVVENDGQTLRDVEMGTVRKWDRKRGRFVS